MTRLLIDDDPTWVVLEVRHASGIPTGDARGTIPCVDCRNTAIQATITARATGSSEATYSDQGHSATVRRAIAIVREV